jgi:hypothetical protein
LVPLRTAAELQRFPSPPIAPLAESARVKAVSTALAYVMRERPHFRLFDGSFILLGDDITLPDDPARVLPQLVQPFANVRGKVNCLIGSADRLARYLEACRPDDRVTPAALLYTPSPGIEAERLRSRLGAAVLVLELGFRIEGAVTIEVPGLNARRLLTDHGTFFEFVPAAERLSSTPKRLTAGEVEPGVAYELVVTAPGGWWACRTGAGVTFDSKYPAMVRFVPLPSVPQPQVIRPVPTIVSPVPRSHPRTSGIPEALPGSSFHTPWSAPVGRG